MNNLIPVYLQQWEEFYAKDYTKVGLLEGRFYNIDGEVTEDWKQLQVCTMNIVLMYNVHNRT